MSYRRLAMFAVLLLSPAALVARQLPMPGQAQLPGQPAPQQEPRGAIWGTVVSGTSGQPVDRVRLRLTGEAIRGTRTVYTNDDGQFGFVDLPGGAYTLSGSKTGYVSVSYGQRNPAAGRPGTPIDLAPGQQIKDLVFQLPPGGVITGMVFDEKNRPSVATPVRVMRWSMSNGERTLASAGTSTTDDRGIYRVYGLPPGEYLVSAMPRNTGNEQAAEMQWVIEERMAELQTQGLAIQGNFSLSMPPAPASAGAEAPGDPDEAVVGYAPVFYPGTLDVGGAAAVRLGVSQELTAVDFALQQVPLARIDGQVIVPPGVNTRTVQVRLYNVAEQVPGVGNRSTRVRDGEFSFGEVPPGTYRVVATADVRGEPTRAEVASAGGRVVVMSPDREVDRLWASSDVSISGRNTSGVTLVLQPGMAVTGSIAYDGSGPPPQSRRIRVTLTPFGAEASASGASSRNATVDETGRFEITGVVPARYRVRASGVSGWDVVSAVQGGVETMDFGLDVTSAQDVTGLQVVFSDRRTELTGSIQDSMGAPTADFTVVVFPTNERYWVPGSRRIQATRPTTSGQFAFAGLPPGDYRVAAVIDVENGTWYDPAFLRQLAGASLPFSLAPGQSVRQDVRVR